MRTTLDLFTYRDCVLVSLAKLIPGLRESDPSAFRYVVDEDTLRAATESRYGRGDVRGVMQWLDTRHYAVASQGMDVKWTVIITQLGREAAIHLGSSDIWDTPRDS
jgi:hypothetical protein